MSREAYTTLVVIFLIIFVWLLVLSFKAFGGVLPATLIPISPTTTPPASNSTSPTSSATTPTPVVSTSTTTVTIPPTVTATPTKP